MTTKILCPELGTWFYIAALAVKGGEPMKTTQWFTRPLEKPYQKGLYIGWRTVFNGTMEMAYEQESWEHPRQEYGRYFQHSESLEIWLFVIKERQNPIRVFPKDAIPL